MLFVKLIMYFAIFCINITLILCRLHYLILFDQIVLFIFISFFIIQYLYIETTWFIFWYPWHKVNIGVPHFVRSTGKLESSSHNLIIRIIYSLTKRFEYTFMKEQITLKVSFQHAILLFKCLGETSNFSYWEY